MKYLLLSITFLFHFFSYAQTSQTLRGSVTDKVSKTALQAATITVTSGLDTLNTISDDNGYFQLPNVKVGRQSIMVTYVGYKPYTLSNIIILSGKETVLDIEMEESFTMKEIVVKANSKNLLQQVNRMATVSARTFSVEDAEKYAGSRGDVARMAMNFAGVSAANDQRNDIIIRGNSPAGLMWRLEDMEIPNPNHFAENGTTGGPIGMLNNNLLTKSDFLTAAFPAEYGNALSGVFDLRMRNGNYNKHEFMFQAGFNGFEAGAEGPLNRKTKASYLTNIRYSIPELISNLNKSAAGAIPKYKDVSYKLNFPLKKGTLTFMGLAGDSKISILDKDKKDGESLYSDVGVDVVNSSRTISNGLSYQHLINSKNYFKIMLTHVYQQGGTVLDTLDENKQPHLNLDKVYKDYSLALSGFFNQKFNNKITTRYGFRVQRMGYELFSEIYDTARKGMKTILDNSRSFGNGVQQYQLYAQASYNISPAITLNPGINFLYLDLNKSVAAEPRIGFKWDINTKNQATFGYGMHSKMQPLAAYFLGTWLQNGVYAETNKNLGFTKAHHWVLGYQAFISSFTRFKTELYYQQLYNVPVTQRPGSFSMLNSGASWGIEAMDSLENKGTGRNYGAEFTFERFFNKNLYYLVTLSLFDSKYKGSDGVLRNTIFNGNYILNLLVGKEWLLNPKSTVNVDIKLAFAGGKRYSPVDLAASRLAQKTVWDETKAFSKQFNPFFKTDIKLGYRRNGKRISQEFSISIENVTNTKNPFMLVYSEKQDKEKYIYQLGFFPMIQYRINF